MPVSNSVTTPRARLVLEINMGIKFNLLLLDRDRLHVLLTQLVLLNLFILHDLVVVLASVPPRSCLTILTVNYVEGEVTGRIWVDGALIFPLQRQV